MYLQVFYVDIMPYNTMQRDYTVANSRQRCYVGRQLKTVSACLHCGCLHHTHAFDSMMENVLSI